jgi:hypothetical protein
MATQARKSSDGKKADKKPQRGSRVAFLPGNTEGAAGRPKGSRNKTTVMIETLLDNEAEAITQALIRRAKKGFAVPLQIVFDRLAPARKDRHVQVDLPPIVTPSDLAVAHGAIIAQVAAGELTPFEGHSLAELLDLRRRALEAVEIEARLAALEARAQAAEDET